MPNRAQQPKENLMTDFTAVAVRDTAERAVEQADVMLLSQTDHACFAHALLSPPEPAPALKRALASRQKLLRTD